MIRKATLTDMPALLALGRQMHAEGVFQRFELAEDKVAATFARCIDQHYLSVSEGHDGLNGMFAGHLAELWWSRRRLASDIVFFVRPDRRGGIAAVRLVQDFVAWASERHADEVSIAQSSGTRVEELHRLMTGMRFEHVGGVYKWRFG